MIKAPSFAPLTRRRLLVAGAALSLPIGCAVPALPPVRDVNLDAMTDEHALLLGRIRVTYLEFDRTGDTFARTTAGGPEMLLPADGDIAWLVRRPRGHDVRLASIASSEGRGYPGGVLLAPHALRTALNYFGTVEISIEKGPADNRASKRASLLKVKVRDESARTMASFVEQNPRLAGRQYCHVLRNDVLEAPRRA